MLSYCIASGRLDISYCHLNYFCVDQWFSDCEHLAIYRRNFETFLKVVHAFSLAGQFLHIYLINTDYDTEPGDDKAWSLH